MQEKDEKFGSFHCWQAFAIICLMLELSYLIELLFTQSKPIMQNNLSRTYRSITL